MSKLFDRRIRWVCVLAVAASMLPNPAALAGTIRHDRNDQLYRSAARTPALAAVMQTKHAWPELGITTGCSGTLISPEWVLLASHCIWSRERGPNAAATVEIGSNQILIEPDNIFINPEWLSSLDELSTIGDIALIRLPRPITHIQPLGLNVSAQEVGKWGYIAGFGSSGTGRTGNVKGDSLKRVGVNVIDATEARVTFASKYPFPAASVGSARALLTDFDDPQRAASTLGDSAPLNMEYTSAKGDSGGPLLLYENGVFTVAGVVSGGVDGFAGTSQFSSFYSDVATFSRVVSYRQWIDRVMSGNAPSLRQLIQSFGPAEAAEARRRVAERDLYYRRHGIRVQSRQAVVEYLPRPRLQMADRLARKPRGGTLTLADDAAANIRRMADQADKDALQFVHLDCASCGGGVAGDE